MSSGQQSVGGLLLPNNAGHTSGDEHVDSPLHRACQEGDNVVIERVLTPSNINSRGRHGWTPIMFAAAAGQQPVFELLASHSADLNTQSDNGDTLLHLACHGGNTDIVQNVLTPVNINSKGMHGWTPVMKSAYCGHREVFEFLVQSKADLSGIDSFGNSLLHLACQGGNIAIVQQVTTPSNINSRGRHGWTPVMKAAVNGNVAVFEFLVSNNSDLSLVDVYGDSLLHLACMGGNISIVKYILSTSPSYIDCRGRHDWTPVMKAAVSGQKSVFEFLVSNNADLTLVDDSGDSLLHLACQGGNRDIVKHVLTPSNISTRGMHGWTPIMKSAVSGHLDIFLLLASNNADCTLLSESGDSVLHLACQGGNCDIVQHVLTPSNINSRGMYGMSPVMAAAAKGHLKVFNFLQSNNADLSKVDDGGDSLLHLACQGGNRDIVQKVLTHTNVNTRGQDGWTPIMVAAAEGHQSVFDYLVSNNADLTLVDDSGNSLLHMACQGGKKDIVQNLLTFLDVNGKGQSGLTPAMAAADGGHKHILELLVENHADLTVLDSEGRDIIAVARDAGKADVAEYLTSLIQ